MVGEVCWGKARGASHPQLISNFTPRGVPNTSVNICTKTHTPECSWQRCNGPWQQPKCPSVVEWMAKVGFSHTLEHYTAMRMKELLLNAATLIIPTNLILSKRSRTQKNTYYVTPLIKCSQRGKSGSLLEVRSGVPLGLGGGWELTVIGRHHRGLLECWQCSNSGQG